MRDHASSGHDKGDMSDTMDEMDHGGEELPGMTAAEKMDALEYAFDAEFQVVWLEIMVERAETAQFDSQFNDAVDLAGQIIDAQKQEIETMSGSSCDAQPGCPTW